jgi:hypothetical protein
MKTNQENNTAADTSSTTAASFGPKEVKAKYEKLVNGYADEKLLTLGKDAQCGKATFLSIYAAMLAEMGVIPPASVPAAYAVFDALPANASAMRQEFEKWNQGEQASSKKANALLGKYGA